MDSLIHNQTFRIAEGDLEGLYRVVINEKKTRVVVIVRIDTASDQDAPDAHSPNDGAPLKTKSSTLLSGKLQWLEYSILEDLSAQGELTKVEIARENFDDSDADRTLFERRKSVMAEFLHFDSLRKAILETGAIGVLVKDAIHKHGVSRGAVYKFWSLLCRFGFSADSLRPRMDRCGAPGVVRDCEDGGRRKNGRKTAAERIAQQTR